MFGKNRFEKKIEITLTPKKISLLLLSILIITLLIFSVGAILGKNLTKGPGAILDFERPYAKVLIEDKYPAEPLPASPAAETGKVSEQLPKQETNLSKTPEASQSKDLQPKLSFDETLTSKQKVAKSAKDDKKNSTEKKNENGRYYVQVGSFFSEKEANFLAVKLKKRGYSSSIAEVKNSDKTYYKVRIGSFASREEAKKMANEIEKKENLKPFITKN